MQINVVPDLAEPVGQHWARLQHAMVARGPFHYAIPLSSTPLPVYDWALDHLDEFGDWSASRFVLMDEQLEKTGDGFRYVSLDDEASYERFAEKHFLSRLREHVPGTAAALKPDAGAIDAFHTPLHLLVLALGVQGNYANVMPGTDLATGWHVAHLTPMFRQAHTSADSKSYALAEFREHGMSLGPQQVKEAGEVLVIASGARKRELYRELIDKPEPREEFPLSVIFDEAVSDRVTIYVTEDVVA